MRPTVGRVRTTRLMTMLVAAALPAALLPAVSSPAQAAEGRHIAYRDWASGPELRSGTLHGLTARKGTLQLSTPVGTRGRYDFGRWRSPWVEQRFSLTELVPSWTASTPRDTFLKVEVRGRGAGRSSWDTITDWALDDRTVKRRSFSGQTDDLGSVAWDTWKTAGVSAWQLRLTLFRRSGTKASPLVERVGAMVSRLPSSTGVTTSRPGVASRRGTVLRVPRYSQMVHRGAYPQYDNGGEAWCSPTSTTMVLGYYDALPPASSYRWVREDYPDRVVAHLARNTYDAGFGGTGNWPFNTAYAASRTGKAFVTRLRSLREAERFVAAGIPLVTSVTFGSGQLSGAPISSTNGHLMVVVGFRKNGDVVVNDPAASTRRGVRRTYDRGQFEDAWLKRGSAGGSGGLTYVVHDDGHPLPPRGKRRNW